MFPSPFGAEKYFRLAFTIGQNNPGNPEAKEYWEKYSAEKLSAPS